MVRLLRHDDLASLMRLYGFFHPEDASPDETDADVQKTWKTILADPHQRYFGVEINGQLMSTCLLTIVPNLTRACRPYGLIENVITDPAWRRKGHATQVLDFALRDAWRMGCYKVMLMTGSKKEETLRFYEKSGFRPNVKTGFVAYSPDYDVTA